MSEAQAEQAAIAGADVKQSSVSTETSEVDDMQAALAAMEAAEKGEPEKPADKPEVKAEGDEKQTEGDAAPKDDEKPPEGPAASGWAKVKKREQKLLEKTKAFEQQQQKFEAQAQQIEARLKSIEEREALIKSDPVAYLSKEGISFDDLVRRYLNDGKASEQEIAKRAAGQQDNEAKSLREELSNVKAMLQRQEETRVIGEYRSNIKSTLSSDEFELLRTHPEAENEIFDFANKWAAKTGEVLQPREVAAKLQEEWRKQLSGLASHKAVRSLFLSNGNGTQTKQQVVSGQSQVPQGNKGASPRTLTNNLAATPPAGEPDWDSLSEEDQIQAALRLVPEA